jgi:hypothetical protein
MNATLPELKLERFLATNELTAKERRGASQEELLLLRGHLLKVWRAIVALGAGTRP